MQPLGLVLAPLWARVETLMMNIAGADTKMKTRMMITTKDVTAASISMTRVIVRTTKISKYRLAKLEASDCEPLKVA